MNDELTSAIAHYVEDESARYAIALEGDWGSGKTRYCDKELPNRLYAKGYNVLRISLFGVTSAEEVYSRLAMSMIRLATSEDESHASRFFKSLATLGGRVAASYGAHKLSDLGISVEASPQMLTGVLGKKHLLILDDAERCEFKDASSFSFYGLVNNLIEAQGCKVIFVTNNYVDIPSEIREKVIWKCFRFEPSPENLAKDIILPRIERAARLPEFEVSKVLLSAATVASCRNARAMIKVTDLLLEAVSSESLSDRQVDEENRECALRDFAQYAFRAAMGNAPSGQFPEGDDRQVQIERIHLRADYNAYQQLWVIKSFFDPRLKVKEGDVNRCLKSYIESNYAGSPETMELKRTLDSTIDLSAMEDDEVAALAAHLSDCLTDSEFDLALLNKAIQLNVNLRRWGFDEALAEEQLLMRGKELVDGNVGDAYRKTHPEFVAWRDEWSARYGVLAELDAYIVDRFEQLRAEELQSAIDQNDPDAGRVLVDVIKSGFSHGENVYLEYEPEFVAELFIRGNAGSQNAIHELIAGLRQVPVLDVDERTREWVKRLYDEMSEISPQSRMGKKRLEWTLDNLKGMLG